MIQHTDRQTDRETDRPTDRRFVLQANMRLKFMLIGLPTVVLSVFSTNTENKTKRINDTAHTGKAKSGISA